MKPIAAGVAGALISGVAMYTLGAKTSQVDAFTQAPATVAVDGQVVPATYTNSFRPVSAPSTAAVPVRNTRRTTTRIAAGVSRAGAGARDCA